jgi:hypothetical protein
MGGYQRGKSVLLIQIKNPSRIMPMSRLPVMSFFSIGSNGSCSILFNSLESCGSSGMAAFFYQLDVRGGITP